MNTGYTNICYFHISLNAPADLELGSLVKEEYVYDFCGCTLDRLHDEVVLVGSLEVHDLKQAASHLVLEGRLAQFALERLPEEALHLVAVVHQLLAIHPLTQTVNVDVTHRARTLARIYQLVVRIVVVLLTQTNPTHSLR